MGVASVRGLRTVVCLCAVAALAVLVVGCGSGDDSSGSGDSGGASAVDNVVSLADAKQAALDAVGDGIVTWSGPEDERGAAWEIEVTRSDGTEVDVLVAADGSVVKQVERYRSSDAPDNYVPSTTSVVSQEEAEAAALAAVGEGTVTWAGREDDRGAAWEIEVTRPDGSEVDVLIAADGSVID